MTDTWRELIRGPRPAGQWELWDESRWWDVEDVKPNPKYL